MKLPPLDARARWAVCVRRGDQVLLAHRDHEMHRTASVGKLLLLLEVDRALAEGRVEAAEPLDRRAVEPVGDSGLWQHLSVDVLPLHDVALLVASVSDNLATNVLLERLGLPAARGQVALHDRVRDVRGPGHPPTLSSGTAAALAVLMAELTPRVRDWLRTGTDLSMVAAAFGLDPLAHTAADLVNKTGTDSTVRADVGVMGAFAYAVLVEWDPGQDLRHEVLDGMRRIGELVRDRMGAC